MNQPNVRKKILSPFFPVTREELLKLKKHGLPNVFFVYFALQLDFPSNLRGEFRIDIKSFRLSWGIPQSSFYAAIGTLREWGEFTIKDGELKLIWNHSNRELSRVLESTPESKNENQDPRINSQILESNSQILEFEDSNRALCNASSSSPDLYRSSLKERERETQNNLERENYRDQCVTFNGSTSPSDVIPESTAESFPQTTENDSSAPETYVSFELEPGCFNWSEYSGPGFAGSPIEFYIYTRAQVVLIAQERLRRKQDNQIGNIDDFTKRCIQNQGAERYESWCKKGRPSEPTAPPMQNGSGEAHQNSKPAEPQLTASQVLENRRKSLEILFENGAYTDMQQVLSQWLSYRDGLVQQLVGQSPHWGFRIKRNRITREVS
jgi:hypothetical protein